MAWVFVFASVSRAYVPVVISPLIVATTAFSDETLKLDREGLPVPKGTETLKVLLTVKTDLISFRSLTFSLVGATRGRTLDGLSTVRLVTTVMT